MEIRLATKEDFGVASFRIAHQDRTFLRTPSVSDSMLNANHIFIIFIFYYFKVLKNKRFIYEF